MVFLQCDQREVLAYLLKHNPYHVSGNSSDTPFCTWILLGNVFSICLLMVELCKITCMLEQHALSKIARSISCWNGVLSYLTLRGAREKKCSGKLLSRFCGGFRVLFGLFVCFPFFFGDYFHINSFWDRRTHHYQRAMDNDFEFRGPVVKNCSKIVEVKANKFDCILLIPGWQNPEL